MKRVTKKWLLVLIVTLVFALLTFLVLKHFSSTSPKTTTQSQPDATINYGPPTVNDKQDSESHKDNISKENANNTSSGSNPATKKAVTPEITTYRQGTSEFTVNGFVNGVVEDGGTCTLTMTFTGNAAQKVTVSRLGEANSSNTTCGEMSIPLSKLHAGTWNTTLTYSSTTSTGVSDVNSLEVN